MHHRMVLALQQNKYGMQLKQTFAEQAVLPVQDQVL